VLLHDFLLNRTPIMVVTKIVSTEIVSTEIVSIKSLILAGLLALLVVGPFAHAEQFGFYRDQSNKKGPSAVLNAQIANNEQQSLYPTVAPGATKESRLIVDFIGCLAKTNVAAQCYQNKYLLWLGLVE
jgi:hypothetical protein